MPRNISQVLPILTALVIVGGIATSASAQTPPQPRNERDAGVREILNRAETESRRRSVGEILGGIAGVSQARAQTAPPATSQSPAPSREPGAVAGTGQDAPAAGPQAPPIPQSTRLSQSAPRAATQPPTAPSATAPAGPSPARGTPSDPSVIATAPTEGASTPQPIAQGPATDAGPQPVASDVSPASPAPPPVVAADGSPRTVIAEGGPRHREFRFRRSGSYGQSPDWCPPDRW